MANQSDCGHLRTSISLRMCLFGLGRFVCKSCCGRSLRKKWILKPIPLRTFADMNCRGPAINEWKIGSGNWRANFPLSTPHFQLPSSNPAKSGHNPAIRANATVSGETRPKRCRGMTLRPTARASICSLAFYPATRREVANVRKCPQVRLRSEKSPVKSKISSLATSL